MHNKNESIKFSVVTIWNLFSPEKLAEIKSVFNTLHFTKGTSSSLKECYLRIVSPTDPPTPFVVGKETPVLYEAVSPSPLEMELISIAKYLIEIQLAFLKQRHPDLQEKEFPMDCNQLQIVVVQLRKAAYQGHSDCGFLLNSHTGKIIVVGERCLPFADEQQTITFCVSKCAEEGNPVTLTWVHKCTKEKLGSIETGDNMAHWQLSGSQEEGILHMGSPTKGFISHGSDWRKIISCRFAIDHSSQVGDYNKGICDMFAIGYDSVHEPVGDYCHVGIIDTIENAVTTSTDALPTDNSTRPRNKSSRHSKPIIDLKSKEYTNLYPQLPLADYLALDIP